MKSVMLAIAILLVAVQVVYAASTYDHNTGNTYFYDTYLDGSTSVRGYNFNTGSTWNTTIDKDGNMRGTDSQGNQWNYNESTGTYYNYGTGDMRNKRYGY